MLRRHWAALNPGASAGPLIVPRHLHLSRVAGSFIGQLQPESEPPPNSAGRVPRRLVRFQMVGHAATVTAMAKPTRTPQPAGRRSSEVTASRFSTEPPDGTDEAPPSVVRISSLLIRGSNRTGVADSRNATSEHNFIGAPSDDAGRIISDSHGALEVDPCQGDHCPGIFDRPAIISSSEQTTVSTGIDGAGDGDRAVRGTRQRYAAGVGNRDRSGHAGFALGCCAGHVNGWPYLRARGVEISPVSVVETIAPVRFKFLRLAIAGKLRRMRAVRTGVPLYGGPWGPLALGLLALFLLPCQPTEGESWLRLRQLPRCGTSVAPSAVLLPRKRACRASPPSRMPSSSNRQPPR